MLNVVAPGDGDYICQETLADRLETTDAAPTGAETFELVDDNNVIDGSEGIPFWYMFIGWS